MAKRKTTELPTITGAQLADGDWFPVVDVSDTTDSTTGSNKKIAKSEMAEVAGLTAHLADTVDAHDASAISVVPAGGIAATTVQAALAELDTEKATTAALTAHLDDTSDAHDASSISLTPIAGLGNPANVQDALASVPSRMALPRRGGFTPTRIMRHPFICFGPAGQIIARNISSTGGRTLTVSTDNGQTWTDTGAPSSTQIIQFGWRLASGTMLFGGNDNILYRSTDLGATSTAVINPVAGFLQDSLVQHSDGTIYFVAYNAPANGLAPVMRSTDDGQTWTTLATIKCSNVYSPAADVVRHPHGCFLIGSDLYIMTGDNGSECGFWRYNGTSTLQRVTPVLADPPAQQYRATTARVRGSHLYWIQDGAGSTAAPVICKAPTSDLATRTVIATLPTGGWNMGLLSDGTIIASGVVEATGPEEDSMVRLWAIDADDIVTEIYSAFRTPAAALPGNYGSIQPMDVRASDDMIGFTVNNVTAGTSGVIGNHRRGGPSFAHRPASAVGAVGTPRTWSRSGTTSAPTTSATSGAPAVMPEMTLTLDVGTAPILITFDTGFAHNTLAGVATFGIRITPGSTVAFSEYQTAAANYVNNARVQTIWTPPQPGRYTVEGVWYVNNGAHVLTGRFDFRRITAVELGA